jgi:Tfp pilus assembly protein PilP
MWAKKGNSIIFFVLFGIAAIPIFLGINSAQAKDKVVLKISEDKKKITEPSKKPEENKADTIETEPKKGEETVAYSYDPTNKVDPFKSFIVVRRELEEEEREKPRTYLETLDVSQLTVSAIVLTSKESWALVRDSKGDGHPIKVGSPIGKRGGRVIKILDKEVVVRESYKDFRGREIVNDISMKLPEVD